MSDRIDDLKAALAGFTVAEILNAAVAVNPQAKVLKWRDPATDAEVDAARALHHIEGEIEIDDGAGVSRGDDGSCWVEAWVYVGPGEIEVSP